MRRRSLMLVLALTLAVVALPQAHTSAATHVGAKAYYLALGDSLAYGYQPNGDYSHGYADDLHTHLGSAHFTNLACPGETTKTFLNGGCPYWFIRKTFYLGSQISAAQSFIKNHPGQVSPVTIDIGANDVLSSISSCTVSSNWTTVLATFDTNFKTILSKLKTSLNGTGDLVAMNYYDPYFNDCASNPAVLADLQALNDHIAQDAAAYSVPVADVFTPFDGTGTGTANTCSYTWMCTSSHDIHATNTGYSVMEGAFQLAEGY